MSSSTPVAPSCPFHSKECKNFRFITFWSKKITDFVDQIEKTGTNARVTHHDLLVNFVNKEYLDGAGELRILSPKNQERQNQNYKKPRLHILLNNYHISERD